jgi:S-phase kinase-associated protein 1
MANLITIKSSIDGETFSVRRDAASISVTIKELIQDLGGDDGNFATEIPVKVAGKYLKLIFDWLDKNATRCEAFSAEQAALPEEERKLIEPNEDDNKFCDAMDDDTKIEMILAANLLDLKILLDLLCLSVAALVKGQSPEELRKVLERTSKPIPDNLAEGIPGIKKVEAVIVPADGLSASGETGTKRKEESD